VATGPSSTSIIQVLRSEAYLAALPYVHETDECLTHIAQLNHPALGTRDYYVKYYLPGAGSKGVVNEVCGFILASEALLPVTERPVLMGLPSERIVEAHPEHARLVEAGDVVVWATQDAGTRLPRAPALSDEIIRKWSLTPALIAFDTWLHIADRSADNLVRRPDGRLALIDHGHMAGSIRWDAHLITPDVDPRHPFLSLWPRQIPEEANQRIMAAASGHAECWRRGKAQIQHWLGLLLDDGNDTIALLDFLEKRAASSPDRMKRVLNLLV
jgi:hypothetical protein